MRLNLDIGYRDVDGKNERSCRDVKKKKKKNKVVKVWILLVPKTWILWKIKM